MGRTAHSPRSLHAHGLPHALGSTELDYPVAEQTGRALVDAVAGGARLEGGRAIPTPRHCVEVSLLVIIGVITVTVVASLFSSRQEF
jgi:hypothetical protein